MVPALNCKNRESISARRFTYRLDRTEKSHCQRLHPIPARWPPLFCLALRTINAGSGKNVRWHTKHSPLSEANRDLSHTNKEQESSCARTIYIANPTNMFSTSTRGHPDLHIYIYMCIYAHTNTHTQIDNWAQARRARGAWRPEIYGKCVWG